MNNQAAERAGAMVSQAWTLMLSIALLMGLSQVFQAAIAKDFSDFAIHPGRAGWGAISVVASIYALMAVLSKFVSAVWFRWFNTALIILVTIYMGAHQAQHAMRGESAGILAVVDLTHHTIGIIGSYWSIRWARSGPAVLATATA